MPQGKRIFVKDFAKCIIPPDEEPSAIAPSLRHSESEVAGNGVGRSVFEFRNLAARVSSPVTNSSPST
jgi:hypothetical protein